MQQASTNPYAAIRGIYIITDRYLNRAYDHITIAQLALNGGAHIIQLRDKHATTRELIEWGARLRRLTHQYDKLFIINDRVDVALAVDADGVHLGDDDMPLPLARKLLGEGKIIGRSVDNVEEARRAEDEGADYVSIGAVFPTNTKDDAAQGVGLEMVRAVKDAVHVPVVAIGGITPANAGAVLEAGADAIAVISAVVRADNPEGIVRQLVHIYCNVKRGA